MTGTVTPRQAEPATGGIKLPRSGAGLGGTPRGAWIVIETWGGSVQRVLSQRGLHI